MTNERVRTEAAGRDEESFRARRSAEGEPSGERLLRQLGARSIVLVGMMGAGKTSLGRRLAARLGLAFADADTEIELAADMSIPEIFARHGEDYFRDGERRVLARLLSDGQKVIATGGGAFMNAATRERIAERAVSIWLKADFDVLMRRVRKRSNRPLLQTEDPEGTLRHLMAERYPIYALADLTIESRDAPHETVVEDVLAGLARLMGSKESVGPPDGVGARAAGAAASAPTENAVVVVPVELGARAYQILVGRDLLATVGRRAAALAPGGACAIVTDENAARHHLQTVAASLEAAGMRHASIVVPAGETSKSYKTYAEVCDGLIGARMERRDLVLALGGGVIGDLAGFAAATVRRGMRCIQLPTTLLAQVDSSVGGKTGINSALGKNLVGAFHQPSLVVADTGALDTLPLREFRAGYAEIAKYGLIGDADFFEWLESNWREIFAGGPARIEAIARSCAAKAGVVARDETETGERALLNLGHTFGHAFERLTDYDGARLVHGEAVAIGMACAFRFSARLGLCPGMAADRVEAHLKAVGLPTRISSIAGLGADAEAILDAMHQDKKVERGRLTFILARAVGASFIAKDVEAAQVRAFLDAELAGS